MPTVPPMAETNLQCPLMTKRQAAVLLGLSRNMIAGLIHDRRLDVRVVGNRTYLTVASVQRTEEWLLGVAA